jgi:hypothetical protein
MGGFFIVAHQFWVIRRLTERHKKEKACYAACFLEGGKIYVN